MHPLLPGILHYLLGSPSGHGRMDSDPCVFLLPHTLGGCERAAVAIIGPPLSLLLRIIPRALRDEFHANFIQVTIWHHALLVHAAHHDSRLNADGRRK